MDGNDINIGSTSTSSAKRIAPIVPPKRRVQFSDSDSLPPAPPPPITNGNDGSGMLTNGSKVTDSSPTDRRYVYDEETVPTPRVQVLGAQEIYRDPRQRRLNEIEATKMRTNRPNVRLYDVRSNK
jgi:hypothetical protein